MTRIILREGAPPLDYSLQELYQELQMCTPDCTARELGSFASETAYFALIEYCSGNENVTKSASSSKIMSSNKASMQDSDSDLSGWESDITDVSSTMGFSGDSDFPVNPPNQAIGFVYLLPTYTSPYLEGPSEFSLGLALSSSYRGYGFGLEVLLSVLRIAFTRTNGSLQRCHRVQAQVLEGPTDNRIIRLLTRLQFTHEGTYRRAFYCAKDSEWKNVTCMGILASDWAHAPSMYATEWEALIRRHALEREELLRLDDASIDDQRSMVKGKNRLTRSDSTETIKDSYLNKYDGGDDSKTANPNSTQATASAELTFIGNEASDPDYFWDENEDDEDAELYASDSDEGPPASTVSLEGAEWDDMDTDFSASSFEEISDSEASEAR
ncbi:hypothetical protein CYLTODRAFT_492875 [Cylindrobasidium torrendii FP15055 ss-10]|uniref:N-acetyltransferase domain-containing protein n=1 Tax=Cylindrobasidium torrendii FP15055 ss-10 TaxID=1314674 RepID=A0A0D7B3H5_9AGAR|nr:hypothetical protein CYLTODRAFT_492875 [Cylindrobasidium torrendii FP15055 ss-10]